ncbi:hypothetical protein [Paenibacillus sp. W2I17]|uniref:hypothetical protein n=1 Tax=Paenibacillus sp. W2I17 TaxID=3042311 RepID=UPI0027841F1A|nr:hypothetical protein [Paenibacillus sp. W2I17]MDQ0658772.1 hypothetical protein [Paenibacillus sp. W2I17]
MSVNNYTKTIPVQAIQFEGIDQPHLNEVIGFVKFPISVDFTSEGITLRVIRNQLDVLVVPVGGYIVKDIAGKLTYMKTADFQSEYVLVANESE